MVVDGNLCMQVYGCGCRRAVDYVFQILYSRTWLTTRVAAGTVQQGLFYQITTNACKACLTVGI